MPLTTFIQRQIDGVQAFVEDPWTNILILRLDAEMERIAAKVLASFEDDEDNEWAFFVSSTAFETADEYFGCVAAEMLADLEAGIASAPDEEAAPCALPAPMAPGRSGHGEAGGTPERRLVDFLDRMMRTLNRHAEALVLVLGPERVQPDAWRASIARLRTMLVDPRVKVIVFDSRTEPVLLVEALDAPVVDLAAAAPIRVGRVAVQTFFLSPDEVEGGIERTLAAGGLSEMERLRYTAVLGGFAFGRKDYEKAETLQRQWLTQAVEAGSASDRAGAHYNLGNTYLAAERWAEAEAELAAGVDVSLDGGLDVLAAMCLTNLGFALYRQARYELALQSFQAAGRTFRALRYLPGEAHVLDSMAAVYEESGQADKARQLRERAVAMYDGMTAPALADAAEAARADLRAKLERTA